MIFSFFDLRPQTLRLPPKQQASKQANRPLWFLASLQNHHRPRPCFIVFFPIQRWMHSQSRPPTDHQQRQTATFTHTHTPGARDCHHETRPVDCNCRQRQQRTRLRLCSCTGGVGRRVMIVGCGCGWRWRGDCVIGIFSGADQNTRRGSSLFVVGVLSP